VKPSPGQPPTKPPGPLSDLGTPEGLAKITRTGTKYDVDPAFLVALRRTEGGGPGREFGVLSVPAPTYDAQLDWAARSVQAAEKRFRATGQDPTDAKGRYTPAFIRFFSAHYAPPGAKNDPQNLNQYHAQNLIRLYRGGAEAAA
jgi:hypothetical protein